MLNQPAFITVSLRAGSSSLKVAGIFTVVRKTDLAVCLSYMVIHKYFINTELYLTELYSKCFEKLLEVKSLMNILKSTYFNIVLCSFFFFFFADIFGLINNLKTFNGHALMLVGTFIDTLVRKNCLVLLWV